MKVALPESVVPIPLGSMELAAAAMRDQLVAIRGGEADRDLGLSLAAEDAVELARDNKANLLAIVRHPDAEPAVLVGYQVTTHAAGSDEAVADLDNLVEDSQQGISQTLRGHTADGNPVLLIERTPTQDQLRAGEEPTWQLQAIAFDTDNPRTAVLHLTTTSDRGWQEIAEMFCEIVSTIDFRDSASS